MYGPIRSLLAFGNRGSAGLLLSAASVTTMFSATPFLIPEVAERYGVSEGSVGLISMVQVGFFAIINFVLPRTTLDPGRAFRWAAGAFVLTNLASAMLTTFWVLMVVRALAGLAAGAVTWVAWGEAMRKPRAMANMAATGPIAALLAAPTMAVLASLGDRAIYLALAIISLPAALLAVELSPVMAGSRRVSRSKSNRFLLLALGGTTFFGSSLFVFASVVARDRLGLSAAVASLGFSLNAGAGFLGARWSARHRRPGWWLMSSGAGAMISVLGGTPLWYFVGMGYWGFAYWMGIPGVFQMLSARSLEPAERAGDAQGVMAVGRSLGPVLGGTAFDSGAVVGMAIAAGVGMAASGVTVIGVQEGRNRLPATPLD